MRTSTNKMTILMIFLAPAFFAACAKPAAQEEVSATSPEIQAVVQDPGALKPYDHVDPTHLIPDKALKQALTDFVAYKSKFPNQTSLAVVDYTAHSSKDRLFVVDMASGRVETYQTAHGKGSDPNNTGYAQQFSNTDGSLMSSVGVYRTAEVYTGSHGRSLALDGLSSSNSNVRSRTIVMHPADYVSEVDHSTGRSWGCPAVDPNYSNHIIDRLKNGAMIYGWNGK